MFNIEWCNAQYTNWMPLPGLAAADKVKIGKSFIIRVDGNVYSKQSEELDNLFNRIILWNKLLQ